MMHHQAGVKVVAVGGRPTTGPMQGVAAGRGARSYGLSVLDANIVFVQNLLASTGSPEAGFLPNRTTANDVYIVDAGKHYSSLLPFPAFIPSDSPGGSTSCSVAGD